MNIKIYKKKLIYCKYQKRDAKIIKMYIYACTYVIYEGMNIDRGYELNSNNLEGRRQSYNRTVVIKIITMSKQ